jgi:hypothetical protein
MLAVLAAVVWGILRLFPSDEEKIRQRLVGLAGTVSTERGEGNIARMAKANRLSGFFTRDVLIEVSVQRRHIPVIRGRDELAQMYLALRGNVGDLKIELLDSTIRLGPEPDEATALVATRATINGEREAIQELRFHFQKIEGDWLISNVQTSQTMQ